MIYCVCVCMCPRPQDPPASLWSAVTVPKVLSLRAAAPSLFSLFASLAVIVPKPKVEGRILCVPSL